MNDLAARKRKRLIVGLCVPAYIPVVFYGGMTLSRGLSLGSGPAGMLGAFAAALVAMSMFISGGACAFSPLSSLAAFVLYLRDPWRAERAPRERRQMLLWIVGSGIAWCAGLAFLAQMVNT